MNISVNRLYSFISILIFILLALIFYFEFCLSPPNKHIETTYVLSQNNSKINHVFYIHYLDSKDKLSIENFIFFMNFAYMPCHPHVFYTFVFNRDTIELDIMPDLLKLIGPKLMNILKNCIAEDELIDRQFITKNTKIITRFNQGGDLCSLTEIMKTDFWINNEKLFHLYFFINSSARGPFLPNYWTRPWWEMFTDIFEQYPNTAIAGPYVSCEQNFHVQSFMIVFDKRGLSIMKNVWRCPYPNEDKYAWISQTEVVMLRD